MPGPWPQGRDIRSDDRRLLQTLPEKSIQWHMLFLLSLSLLSVVTLGSVVAYQRGAHKRLDEGLGADRRRLLTASSPPAPPATDRTLDTLQVGDVVVDGDEDWLIIGTLTYQEEEERWCWHHLDSGRHHRWLEVRPRGGHRACFWEPAADLPAFGQLPNGLTHRGVPYRLWRRGDARVTADGEVGARAAGTLRYTIYEGPGGAMLHVEDGDGARRAYGGTRTQGAGLMFMPGERPTAPEEDLWPVEREES